MPIQIGEDKIIYSMQPLGDIFSEWLEVIGYNGDIEYSEDDNIYRIFTDMSIGENTFDLNAECNAGDSLLALCLYGGDNIPPSHAHSILELINVANTRQYSGHFELVDGRIRFRHVIDVEEALPTPSLLSSALHAGAKGFGPHFLKAISDHVNAGASIEDVIEEFLS